VFMIASATRSNLGSVLIIAMATTAATDNKMSALTTLWVSGHYRYTES